MQGWARIIGIKNAGLHAGGGWSGWVHLSGEGYGVKLNADKTFSADSYAWSDELGWMNFSRASFSTKKLEGFVDGSPNPTDAGAPVTITAHRNASVSNTTGPITYELDCENDGTFSEKAENITQDSYTFANRCSYASSDHVAVRITQEGVSAFPTAFIAVGCIDYACDTSSGKCSGLLKTTGTCTTGSTCSASCSIPGGGSGNDKWKEVTPW